MRVHDCRKLQVGDPIFVGISSMSGQQIRHGLYFAKKVRESDPSIPIVWGGVHPTLLPEQTVSDENVDIVVRGEGEATVVELAERISKGQSLVDMEGTTIISEGKTRNNPSRELIDLNAFTFKLPYDLIPMKKYPSVKAGRFHIQTSRGCPHRCGFCYNSVFNNSCWRGRSPHRVLNEIEYILMMYPETKCIDIIDDNFFVEQSRVRDICKEVIERGIDVTWRVECRFDYMCGYSEEFIGLLERSGCTELNFGAETGSERLLELIKKDITPDQMLESVKKLKKVAPSIEPYLFWMSGLPTETRHDLEITFKLMERLSLENEKTQHVEIFIYTPFPSPMQREFDVSSNQPGSLKEWGEVNMFRYTPSWHSKEYVDFLKVVSTVTKYTFFPAKRVEELKQPYKAGYKLIHKLMEYRWRNKYFGAPYELKLLDTYTRIIRGY